MRGDGKRVFAPGKSNVEVASSGAYTNSREVTLSLTLEPDYVYTVVASSYAPGDRELAEGGVDAFCVLFQKQTCIEPYCF